MEKYGKNNVIIGLFWRFMERFGAQLVSLVVSIILARILDPTVYGTVALVTILVGIMQVFVDGGLGNALIQKKDVDHLDFSTVFYTNIVFCSLIYFLIYISAPVLSRFYNNMELVPIIRVLGITILISGLKNVQQAYVSKHMLFKKFFFSTLGGTILAAIIGITVAYFGGGVWALVLQQVVNLTVDTIILWFTVDWKPKLEFSFKRLKELYSYGWKLLVSALLEKVYTNIYQLVIGKVYSTQDLAYYNKADQFPNLIVMNINTSIDSVLLPAMSEQQDSKESVKRLTRRAIMTSMYIMSPIMIGFACIAEEFISIVLTDKWLPAVPFLQVFCVVYMFYPIHTSNLNAIKAVGRSDVFLRLEIIKKIIGILLLLISVRMGVMAMAFSLLVNSLVSQVINAWPSKSLLDYGFVEQMKDVLPTVLLTIVMVCCISIVNIIELPAFVSLVIKVVIGVLVYVVGSVVTKNEVFLYFWEFINNIFKRKRRER